MPRRQTCLLFTCEHASRFIPARFREVMAQAGAVLDSHRGYDPGALVLAKELAKRFQSRLFVGRYSRLLIELNRSLRHPQLWSEFSENLATADKAWLLQTCYHRYREAVQMQICQFIASGRRVLHVSVHSFTPTLGGTNRLADVGLLYDPARSGERQVCARWKLALEQAEPALRVRRNYPYLGIADGLVTHLRQQFAGRHYAGIELEVNQGYPLGDQAKWKQFRRLIAETLVTTLNLRQQPAM